jgi:hypothetical protein
VSLATRAFATAALGVLLAIATVRSPVPIWLVLTLLPILVGLGWGHLLHLPDPATAAVIVATAGLAFVATAFLAPAADLGRTIALIIALSLIVTFFSQMLRNPRPRLVETVAGIITGVVAQLGLVGWILAARTMNGHIDPEPYGAGWGLTLARQLDVHAHGYRILPVFALVLAGCALVGAALAQNWPGNPHAAKPLWQSSHLLARPASERAGAVLATLAGAAAIVSAWGVAPLLVARLLRA